MKNSYMNIWNDLHKDFAEKNKPKYDEWLEEFETIISKTETDIVDLGCGVTGNNTLYLLEKGKKVISCDFSEEALKVVSNIKGAKTLLFDMLQPFPFEDNFTDLVIADLSLHYFREKDTHRIISEINRILKPNGYLFLRLNSTNSTEYKEIEKNGEEIEPHLVYIKNLEKRFFSREDIDYFFSEWKYICLKEENMSRWCSDKIVWKGAMQKWVKE